MDKEGVQAEEKALRYVAKAADGRQQVVTADIDMQRLQRFREKFPVLADRDDFRLE